MLFRDDLHMGPRLLIVPTLAILLTVSCAGRIPQPAGVSPRTPRVSWVIMSGDREDPNQEFVCQSDPPNDCIVPMSRPDALSFSDVHIYYHGAGKETRYTGSIQIGFFRGSAASQTLQTNIAVQKAGSITNQSTAGIVTDAPGTYAVTFDLVATVADSETSQPIRQQVQVVVK